MDRRVEDSPNATTEREKGPTRPRITIPPREEPSPTALRRQTTNKAAEHPALVYLLSLGSNAGRESMSSALETAARNLGYKTAAGTPWAQLRYANTAMLRTMLQHRYATATANKILSAVRGTLRAAWKLGQIPGEDYRQAVSVRAVRGHDLPRGRALESGEVRSLFEQTDARTPAGARDAAMLALLFGCGMRRAEVAAAQVQEIDSGQGTLRVRGKGNRERLVPINRGAMAAINNWLDHRGREDGPLLRPVTRHGLIEKRGITPSAIRLRLKQHAERAGIEHCSPHDLRRTFVSMLLDEGTDITTVGKMAGHANVQTTARYDRRDERTAKTAAEQLHVPVRRQEASSGKPRSASDEQTNAVDDGKESG